jgi:hypothetical protein
MRAASNHETPMRRIAKVAAGAVLLVLFGACGSQVIGSILQDAGQSLMDAGTAHGQVPNCRWEVQKLSFDEGKANQMPVGWEPFSAIPYSSTADWVFVRRCVP